MVGGKDGSKMTAGGRPRKNEVRIPEEEVDRLLVQGEAKTHPSTGASTIYFPSYREIADRFGVANSSIAQFAAKHNCLARRTELQRKTRVKAEEKLATKRADAIVMSSDETIGIVDAYIRQFYQALDEGKVRCDNPADLNTMVRLKQLLLGDADSRQELQQNISLEVLAARHQEMLRVSVSSSAERGVPVHGNLPTMTREDLEEGDSEEPSTRPFEGAREEPTTS